MSESERERVNRLIKLFSKFHTNQLRYEGVNRVIESSPKSEMGDCGWEVDDWLVE